VCETNEEKAHEATMTALEVARQASQTLGKQKQTKIKILFLFFN
jgi:hypothetical protein